MEGNRAERGGGRIRGWPLLERTRRAVQPLVLKSQGAVAHPRLRGSTPLHPQA